MSEFTKDGYPKFEDWAFTGSVEKNNRTQTRGRWGFNGYYGDMIEMALRRDDPEAFLGFMRESKTGRNVKTFDEVPMDRHCERKNAPKCKAALAQLEESFAPA
jgi:hypothetical protein